VSPGTVVHDDARRANVPWRRNGCAWARRTLNSRQSAETTPTATPRCPSVLSPLLRCPCSPGPEPVTPSSSTGSTSPSETGSTTSAFRSGSSALAAPSTRVRSRTWRGRPGPERQVMAGQEAARAGPLARVPGAVTASRITVAGMPAPPMAPATSADHRHDPCQASSQGCPNERADYLFGPGTGGPVGDQHADHNGGYLRCPRQGRITQR
jgi:hypothetical protein